MKNIDISRLVAKIIGAEQEQEQEQEFHNIAITIADTLGTEYFVYSQYQNKGSIDENPQSDVTISNLPSFWIEEYSGAGLIHNDPTIIPIIGGDPHHIWSRESIDQADTTPDKKFVKAVRDLDLTCGVTIALKSNNGFFAYMSWISNSNSGMSSTTAFEIALPTLTLLSEMMHVQLAGTMVRQTLLNRRGVPNKNLSPRELEVMQWLAQGKTAWEISVILSISQKAVELYGSNAIKKLGANNRTQAVAHALSLDIISLPSYLSW